MPHRRDWLVVGISGVTCGGKTTLANRLLRSVQGSVVLHQDKYFLPDAHPRHVPVQGLAQPHHNYDILSALDMNQMYSDALSVMQGQPCPAAEESASESEAEAEWALRLPGRRLLLLEGFSVLNHRALAALCELRLYLLLEFGECAARRALRLYDPPDVAGYFELCVWPEHLRYRAEIEKDPTVMFLDGTRPDVFEQVVQELRALGAADAGDDASA